MARLPRLVIAGQPLYIIHRGNNRQAVFFREEDYQRFLSDLAASAEKYGCQIHAYVLMTNRINLLLTPIEIASVSRMMQAVGRRYVRYINTEYRRSGTLWEGRFKSGLIDTERYLLLCYRAIEMNPVSAGMVESPADYRWSSYHRNALGQADGLVVPHAEYQSMGIDDQARRRAYMMSFEEELRSQDVKAIHEGTERGEAIGSERFQEAVAEILKRRVKRVKHGGDRKSEGYQQMRED